MVRVRPLPEPPLLLRHLEVEDLVHHPRDFGRRHSFHAQQARVAVSAHPEDRMRAALEREDPALDEGDEEVGGHEALRLLEHPESADGGCRIRRKRLWLVAPVGPRPHRRAGFVGQQVDEVDSRVDVLNIEIRLLPQFYRP